MSAIRQARLFIEKHGDARFQSVEDSAAIVSNRAGWRQGQGNEQRWLVLPEVWRSEVCCGFDPVMVAKALADRGMLVAAGDGYQKVHWLGGRSKRFYTITDRILAGLDDESGVRDVRDVRPSVLETADTDKSSLDFNGLTCLTPLPPQNHKETEIHVRPPREKPMADRGEATNNGQGHKCDHCGEFGDTLECGYGSARPWLHRECQDAWRAEYDEQRGGLDIPKFLDRRDELRA